MFFLVVELYILGLSPFFNSLCSVNFERGLVLVNALFNPSGQIIKTNRILKLYLFSTYVQ